MEKTGALHVERTPCERCGQPAVTVENSSPLCADCLPRGGQANTQMAKMASLHDCQKEGDVCQD